MPKMTKIVQAPLSQRKA